MKKIVLVLTVSFFAVSVYAQNSTQNEYEEWKPSQDVYGHFDIGKFKTPDIVRNQLEINFNFQSNNSINDYSYSDRDSRSDQSNLVGYISSYFSHYVNTRKKISTLIGSLSIEENKSNSKDKETVNNFTGISKVSSLSQRNSLSLSWLNKWYFSKSIYLDYDMLSSISYLFSQDKTKNQSEDSNLKQKNFSFNISPQIGIGYGRIENVRDARQVVYIANALAKKMVLTRNLSDDELFELSKIISTVKNKRFLDARLRLIEEITTLDAFFTDKDLLADNSAAYFTTLYDMWQYGDNFPRNSGYEISFLVRPNYGYQNAKYTPNIQDIIFKTNQHEIGLNFGYEKPFKLKWQHSTSAMVFGGINSTSIKSKQMNDLNNNIKTINASVNYSLGYYPNTRTHIQVTTRQQLLNTNYKDDRHSTEFFSSLGANLYYYFSPNLLLTGDCSLYYSPRRYKGYYANRDNRFSSSFFIRLTYLLF